MSRLVRSELLKLSTTRLWMGLLLGLVLTSVAFAVLTAVLAGSDSPAVQGAPALDDPATVRSVYTAGLGFAYLFALVLGVTAMAGEFRHQTITASVLAVPRRWRIVVAKLAAVGAVGIGYGIATVAASTAGGAPVLAIRGAAMTGAGLTRALALAVLAVALWAVIGLGVGTLIRNQVLALLLAVGIAWIAEPIVSILLNLADLGVVAKFLPTQATTAVVEPALGASGIAFTLLPWWGGVLVLAGYAAVSGALGVALTLRRDIS
jgi:ABC-2 type transport system permease protein